MISLNWIDAHPDRFDERDYLFRPRLQAAPVSFLNDNARREPAQLQRGGSCTGYAAAGLVDVLLRDRKAGWRAGQRVSPAMLYHLALMYDEWEGEDYEGSSCRAVLKGWHHHGVCERRLWKDSKHWQAPADDWQRNAALYPIGAYYRVDRRSITDLRLALCEARVALVSARIHQGWLGRFGDEARRAIEPSPQILGLHAFLLVGYDEMGFVVKNSWGPGWGCEGLAILRYRDWLDNGIDAWVVSLGVPTTEFESPPVRSTGGLLEPEEKAAETPVGDVWSETEAREHSTVFAKNGKPARRKVAIEDGESELRYHLGNIATRTPAQLLLYFSGGLETEDRALARIRQIGRRLADKNVTPFFVLWRTGLLDELVSVVSPQLAGAAEPGDPADRPAARDRRFEVIARRSPQLASAAKHGDLAGQPEARDRRFEVIARRYLRPLWTEVKADSRHTRSRGGGLSILAQELRSLIRQSPRTRLHLAAHSAGVLPLAYLLELLGPNGRRTCLPVASCTLLAPLCAVSFAHRFFHRAVEEGVLGKGALKCVGLRDEVERVDGIGELYGPSLPMLVSRALERDCDTPILCLEQLWDPPPEGDRWNRDHRRAARQWRVFRAAADVSARFLGPKDGGTDGTWPVSPGHQAFERDLDVFDDLARRCLA